MSTLSILAGRRLAILSFRYGRSLAASQAFAVYRVVVPRHSDSHLGLEGRLVHVFVGVLRGVLPQGLSLHGLQRARFPIYYGFQLFWLFQRGFRGLLHFQYGVSVFSALFRRGTFGGFFGGVHSYHGHSRSPYLAGHFHRHFIVTFRVDHQILRY